MSQSLSCHETPVSGKEGLPGSLASLIQSLPVRKEENLLMSMGDQKKGIESGQSA